MASVGVSKASQPDEGCGGSNPSYSATIYVRWCLDEWSPSLSGGMWRTYEARWGHMDGWMHRTVWVRPAYLEEDGLEVTVVHSLNKTIFWWCPDELPESSVEIERAIRSQEDFEIIEDCQSGNGHAWKA